MSKVLHFMNPEFLPIWDSRVATHFSLKNAYQVNKRNYLLEYLLFIGKHKDLDAVKKVQEVFSENAGYKVTKVRACEFILFSV